MADQVTHGQQDRCRHCGAGITYWQNSGWRAKTPAGSLGGFTCISAFTADPHRDGAHQPWLLPDLADRAAVTSWLTELSRTIVLSTVWDGPMVDSSSGGYVYLCRWCGDWSLTICIEPDSWISDFGYQILVEEGAREHETQCKPDLTSPPAVMGWLTT